MTALRVTGCILAFLVWIVPAWGQTTVTLQPDSEFWIEGRTSVNTFTCRVKTVHGRAQVADASQRNVTAVADTDPEATIRVPVDTFDCGKRRMTEDLQETLEAEAHPTIQYELKNAEVVGVDSSEGRYQIRARGDLTIAGTTRTVELTARGQRIGDQAYRLCGKRTLQMTDFGIEPPTKLLGLIQVKDQIEVHFNLVAVSASVSTTSTLVASRSSNPGCTTLDR